MVLMLSEMVNTIVAMEMFAYAFPKAIISYLRVERTDTKKYGGKGIGKEFELPSKLPSAVDIKKTIPKHCFQPTVATSMYYVAKDLTLVTLTYALVCYLHQIPSTSMYIASLLFYWALQGTLFTSIFVLGHDCGHGSFSDHTLLNDIVGTVLHSFILCPYYAFKISHRNHHRNTCNFDKDEVFHPAKKSDPCAQKKTLPAFGFGIGWWGYLVRGYTPRAVSHFNINHPKFKGHLVGMVLSLAMYMTSLYGLYHYTMAYGFWALIAYYLVPLFIYACYMTIITFLHHHDENVPWYADENWNFVSGQLSTIDRHYGPVHDMIHTVGLHQMHHMFAKIPHYHLQEATDHFGKAFPELVRYSEEPIMPAFMRMCKKWEKQNIIDDECKKHVYL